MLRILIARRNFLAIYGSIGAAIIIPLLNNGCALHVESSSGLMIKRGRERIQNFIIF